MYKLFRRHVDGDKTRETAARPRLFNNNKNKSSQIWFEKTKKKQIKLDHHYQNDLSRRYKGEIDSFLMLRNLRDKITRNFGHMMMLN